MTMSTKPCFIFYDSELYLPCGPELPAAVPEEFAGRIILEAEVCFPDNSCRGILLGPGSDRASVICQSVGEGSCSGVRREGCWYRLRDLHAHTDPAFQVLSSPATRALGLLNWYDSARFCSFCGGGLQNHAHETALVCISCGRLLYPRISPAVIVLVEHPDGRILLARHKSRNQSVFSCIAGYLEHGERLEDCVRREVMEETGLELDEIRYAGSQSWPYPDQYMIAFRARAKTTDIRIRPEELLEARWFSLIDLPPHPAPGTVAWSLIHGKSL